MEQQNNLKMADITPQELEERFYNNLEEADTLIDYFGVVGLDQLKVQQIAAQESQQIAANRYNREETLNELK